MRHVSWPLSRRVLALLVAGMVALGLALTGCGSDDELQASPTASPPPASTPTDTTPTTEVSPSPGNVPTPTPVAEPWNISVEGVEVTFNPVAIDSLAKAIPQALEGTPGQGVTYELASPLDLEIRQAVAVQLVFAEPSLQNNHADVLEVMSLAEAIALTWAFHCLEGETCDQSAQETVLPVRVIRETENSPDQILAIGPGEGAAWVYLTDL